MGMLLPAAEMQPAEREAPRIPGVGKAPVVLMSTAVLPISIDCVKLRLRSCRNTVLCPGAEFLQIHQFDGATPHQPAAQSPVAPLRFVEMLQRMVVPSDVALPCTWDSEDATTSAIDVLSDLDADGLVRPDESARIPGLALVSQVNAFRFLVMLQKLCLIDRVLGFADGHIRSSRFRFFLLRPPAHAGRQLRLRMLASSCTATRRIRHANGMVPVSVFSFGDAAAFVRPIYVSGQRTSCSRSVDDYRPGDHHAGDCLWD